MELNWPYMRHYGEIRDQWVRLIEAVKRSQASWDAPLGGGFAYDELCRSVASECLTMWCAIPEQLAMVGCGNESLICNAVNPKLSSIDMGDQQYGYESARILDGMMQGETPPTEAVYIYTSPKNLVVRHSSDVFAVSDPKVAQALRFMADNAREALSVQTIARSVGLALKRRFNRYVGRKQNRDQKRKDKLAKKQCCLRKSTSLAYMGDKFKSEKVIPTWMHAEIGIYESYVMTDRRLLDQTVATAVEKLIRQMRAGSLPVDPDSAEIHYEIGQEEDLVIGNIIRNWAIHFQTEWRPPRDQRIGVLRTILGSIEKMRVPGPRSQSYMHHITGFLTKQLGVKVESFSADRKRLPEPKEDELISIGRRWVSGNETTARNEFREMVDDLISNGRSNRVLDLCHRLLSEQSDSSSEVVADFTEMIGQAQRSLVVEMG